MNLQSLYFVKKLPLVCPDVELLGKFWNNEERPPAPNLLRLEDVTKYMISNVQDITSSRSHHNREHVTGTCVHMCIVLIANIANIQDRISIED